MILFRRALFQTSLVAIALSGCSGGGCGGCDSMEPIPGGFPGTLRSANAIQVRLTSSAIAAIEADPALLVGNFLGGGGLTIDIPASCSDPEICCDNGVPAATCGPIDIDLGLQMGDAPRLEIVPQPGQQQIDVTIRARLASLNPIPFSTSGLSCDVSIDTAGGSRDELTITMTLDMPLDADENTTRLDVTESSVDFEDEDITLSGNLACELGGSFIPALIVELLSQQINDSLAEGLSGATCLPCESGTIAECGAYAEECVDNVCMLADRCEQQIGISGRMPASALLGGTGQLGALDIYEVAGNYTETDDDGLSMGMYSGAMPFAEKRDRCGPPASAPPVITVPQSNFFAGNLRPDTNAPFGIGFGIHQQVLDQFAYAAYESGALCMNFGPDTVDLLTTDGLGPLIMPSASDLLHNRNSPIILGLRPQSPPTIAIGPGTTTTNESGETIIDEPLLDVNFDDMEIDFHVLVDQQFIRVMTLSIDLRLPINLDINEMGEIQPVVGDLEEAITDVNVSNSEALAESNEELADKIPLLLSLALPGVVDNLGTFALPDLGGLSLTVAPDGILSIEENSFLAIFADLALTTPMARVVTEAHIVDLIRGESPTAILSLGGDSAGLEFSYQINGGTWSPYTQSTNLSLSRSHFKIAGQHSILVRGREVGKPMSADLTPVELSATFQAKTEPKYFHGGEKSEGCGGCDSSGQNTGNWILVLLGLGALAFRGRKRSFSTKGLGALVLVGTLSAVGPGCSCSSDAPGCPDGCLEGAVEPGATGRYSSIDSADGRVVLSAYEEKLGDLVLVEPDKEGVLQYKVIAGVPVADPTYDPRSYRGGIAAAGADVGSWTSIKLYNGLAVIAYVDNDTGRVHLAREQDNGSFLFDVVDNNPGLGGASYVSLSLSAEGVPSVAYLASGIPSIDSGAFLSEVRVSSQSKDWAPETVDVGPISCAAYCAEGESCVNRGDFSECVTASLDCEGGCGDEEACDAGVCLPVLPVAPGDIPDGVGLFAQLVHLPNGTQVVGYYDRNLGEIRVATLNGPSFSLAASLNDEKLDLGMWLSMTADSENVVHLAYQDSAGDQLMYSTFSNGSVLSETQVIDNGERPGETRTHPVGASASIIVNADRIPTIVYQDGLTADLEMYRLEAGSWRRTSILAGERLDGFFIDSVRDGDTMLLSHYFYDRSSTILGELEIVTLP